MSLRDSDTAVATPAAGTELPRLLGFQGLAAASAAQRGRFAEAAKAELAGVTDVERRVQLEALLQRAACNCDTLERLLEEVRRNYPCGARRLFRHPFGTAAPAPALASADLCGGGADTPRATTTAPVTVSSLADKTPAPSAKIADILSAQASACTQGRVNDANPCKMRVEPTALMAAAQAVARAQAAERARAAAAEAESVPVSPSGTSAYSLSNPMTKSSDDAALLPAEAPASATASTSSTALASAFVRASTSGVTPAALAVDCQLKKSILQNSGEPAASVLSPRKQPVRLTSHASKSVPPLVMRTESVVSKSLSPREVVSVAQTSPREPIAVRGASLSPRGIVLSPREVPVLQLSPRVLKVPDLLSVVVPSPSRTQVEVPVESRVPGSQACFTFCVSATTAAAAVSSPAAASTSASTSACSASPHAPFAMARSPPREDGAALDGLFPAASAGAARSLALSAGEDSRRSRSESRSWSRSRSCDSSASPAPSVASTASATSQRSLSLSRKGTFECSRASDAPSWTCM
eukprot:TRINITY_DN25183_c0_g1_i2.p1 TRINITY_DN25183_c0_g1~~TRINITY_DN25183_c0_g1_i2.p1  ORF type:complete len:526 (+),score=92.12 TRINITY_DN25183_c0_g1_i2:105-1682(+)